MKAVHTSTIYDNPLPQLRSRQGFFPSIFELFDGRIGALTVIGEAFESVDSACYVSYSSDGGKSFGSHIAQIVGIEVSELFNVENGGGFGDAAHFKQVADIIKADPSRRYVIPSAPGKRSKTDTKVVLKNTDGYEYSMDAVTWQSSSVFTGLLPARTYTFYQRVAATDKTNARTDNSADRKEWNV